MFHVMGVRRRLWVAVVCKHVFNGASMHRSSLEPVNWWFHVPFIPYFVSFIFWCIYYSIFRCKRLSIIRPDGLHIECFYYGWFYCAFIVSLCPYRRVASSKNIFLFFSSTQSLSLTFRPFTIAILLSQFLLLLPISFSTKNTGVLLS